MRRLSLAEHGAVELLGGVAWIAAAVALGAAGEALPAVLLAGAAAVELALTSGTRWTRGPKRRRPRPGP